MQREAHRAPHLRVQLLQRLGRHPQEGEHVTAAALPEGALLLGAVALAAAAARRRRGGDAAGSRGGAAALEGVEVRLRRAARAGQQQRPAVGDGEEQHGHDGLCKETGELRNEVRGEPGMAPAQPLAIPAIHRDVRKLEELRQQLQREREHERDGSEVHLAVALELLVRGVARGGEEHREHQGEREVEGAEAELVHGQVRFAVHEGDLILDGRQVLGVVLLEGAVREQHVEVTRLVVVVRHVALELEVLAAAARHRPLLRLHALPPDAQPLDAVAAERALAPQLCVLVPLVVGDERQDQVVAPAGAEVRALLRVEVGLERRQVVPADLGGAEAELRDGGLGFHRAELGHTPHDLGGCMAQQQRRRQQRP
mmetsp:Transcript_14667/g.44058  ORF Transcript_14667/g.44058 Transcript_14667/m.44058 type:complete len:369 (+) Transcript_14667:851-1957(+)